MAGLDKDIIIQYALKELSTEEMERVKREIDSDPAAQEELKTYQLSLNDLDEKFKKIHDEPIPSDISQRIDQVASSLEKKSKEKISFFPYLRMIVGGSTGGAIATAIYMAFYMMTPAAVTFKGPALTDMHMYTRLVIVFLLGFVLGAAIIAIVSWYINKKKSDK